MMYIIMVMSKNMSGYCFVISLILSALLFPQASFAQATGANNYCPDAKDACYDALYNMWDCAELKCGKKYLWCEEAQNYCSGQLQAAQACIRNVCGNKYTTPTGASDESFGGFSGIKAPYARNAVSATADNEPSDEVKGREPYPVDPYRNSGPSGSETYTNLADQLKSGMEKGGPSDWVSGWNHLEAQIIEKQLKSCFYGAGEEQKKFYDEVIAIRAQGFTGKYRPSANEINTGTLALSTPLVDCDWALEKAGF